jgi:hypothetical protein
MDVGLLSQTTYICVLSVISYICYSVFFLFFASHGSLKIGFYFLTLLCVTHPLSLILSLFCSLFHIYLSRPLLLRSFLLYTRLLHSRFIRAGLAHQHLPLCHHPYRLQIKCFHPHPTLCLLSYGKVNVLAPLTIPSVSLYPLVVCLLHFNVLSPISLLFPF